MCDTENPPRLRPRIGRPRILHFGLVLATLLIARESLAVAYCALRDPDRQIQELYPDATGHLSRVAMVDSLLRDELFSALPFDLHAREVGRHTLYVVLEGARSVGLVHVRTEASQWGLMEVVWSLSSDLRVNDFRFQRCRGPACSNAEASNLRELLAGRSAPELMSLLDGGELDAFLRGHPRLAANDAFVRALVESAVKTITVTEAVWPKETRGS
jgi:hypothetical protein